MDMNGVYLGGAGFDFLELYNSGAEGVKVDFGAGDFGNNSAFANVAGQTLGLTLMNLKA